MNEEDKKHLKQKLQVLKWSEVDESKGVELVEKVQSGEISKEEWEYLKAVVPKFADVVSTGLTTIGSIAIAVAGVQSEAMKAMQEGIKAAKEIAVRSNDPEVHKLALKSIDNAYERIERMNKESGSWGGLIIGAIVTVVDIGAWVVTGGKIGPKTIA